MPCRNRFRKALKRLFNSVYSYRLQIVPATEHVCLSTFRLCPAPDFVRLPASKRGRIPSGTSTESMPPPLRHPVSLILIQVFALLVVVVDIDDTDALVRHDLQLDLILPHPAAAQRPQAVIQVGRNVRAAPHPGPDRRSCSRSSCRAERSARYAPCRCTWDRRP